ncbi:MAG: Mrp/NBP35 family ATP-binding protein [Acidimicrobiia bacterium]|nr:Mrp/NBP35 family ATP-binding protein [Acidimicrobiia bacterium]
MPTEAQVLDALRPVQDPELQRSIVDLDMVRGVRIDDGVVGVTVALTIAGCPLRAEITDRVTRAVQPLEGVRSVAVDLTVMTDDERGALKTRLQGAPGAASAEGAPPIPFADPSSRTRVLGLSSGKGGVGKSSVTVNLAVALANLGHEVAVLDADVYGFSVPKMMGVTQEPVVIDGMIVPPVAHGVKVISTGFFVGEDQPVIWRGPMLHKALNQFLTDVLWGEPDYLLVDMPPGTGDVALSLAQFMPRTEVFVVTTPQPAAQRVAQRSALMARKVNMSVRGVIENMSWFTGDDGKRYPIFGAGGGQLLADDLSVPLLAQVPLMISLREGGDGGTPVTVADPDSEASLAFVGLAQRVAALGATRVFRPELKIT